MNQDSNKILWVIAGANGSGKTSLVQKYKSKLTDKVQFVNPDDIAKKIDDSYDGKDMALIQRAGRETIKIQRELFKNGKSFGFETTFSGQRDLRIMQQAKDLGYNVKLAYIGLNSPINNIKRVNDRVVEGGHFVAPKDIVRRYDKSMANLLKGARLANSVYIFDNSKDNHYLVMKIRDNKIIRNIENKPKWIPLDFMTFIEMLR